MPSSVGLNQETCDLRRAFERLDGLPVRPVSARAVLGLADDQPEDREVSSGISSLPKFLEMDPGLLSSGESWTQTGLLRLIAVRSWWRASSANVADALESLWKHAIATAISARRLGAEAGRTDLDALSHAGLLHQLGLWAIAAVAPERFASLMAIQDRAERRRVEIDWFGRDSSSLGADLARRWGLAPAVEAAAWLHADLDGDLDGLSDDPTGLRLIQRAHAMAEKTPWALFTSGLYEPGLTDPRIKLLVAEVQVRSSSGLLDPEATVREESVSRDHARLILRHAESRRQLETQNRLLRTMAEASSSESPAQWTERAARAWCEEPGIASAKVVWLGEPSTETIRPSETVRTKPRIVVLGRADRPAAELHLWMGDNEASLWSAASPAVSAWGAWADLIADRDRLARNLDEAVASHRERIERGARLEGAARLEALAEFAGGAGHELNNPLAVIVGRAQLLIPKVTEPDAVKSLRIIINQAQRAHRILRDLMYVARPPAPRQRPCQPDEILRASLRDFRDEAESRGIALTSEIREPIPVAWADPDPLRHLADVLIRNALEATPSGGNVRVTSSRVDDRLRWVVRDSGRGITAHEANRLFDPFFCGRQAGRGLGLGLPRASRFATQVGGSLSWRSSPGQGTSFSVEIPIEVPPSG